MERLAAQNPADRESHLALAEAALMAGLPGEARRRLDMARAAPPGATPRLCLLLARLEEAEGGTPARQREWLDRAAAAPPDPRYVCENCRGESLDWASRCPHCGGFDTLSRGMPSWAAPGEDVPALARTDPAKDDTAGFYLPEEPLGARFGTG
jgi:HemY protein